MSDLVADFCKYCNNAIEDVYAEGVKCEECGLFVHVVCLKRGSVPGGLSGDIFFTFTCFECSPNESEVFIRDRMPWFQAIVLMLYHINAKNPGLARKGYFHWKMHLATLIDKHWAILFSSEFKRKKKWIGSISGTLSHCSPYFFHSGTTIFGEQGWWTLTFPKLTPSVIMKLNVDFSAQKLKAKETLSTITDVELLKQIILSKNYDPELAISVFDKVEPIEVIDAVQVTNEIVEIKKEIKPIKAEQKQKKALLPTLEALNEGSARKLFKTSNGAKKSQKDSSSSLSSSPLLGKCEDMDVDENKDCVEEPIKFMDAMCHYNTALNSISQIQGIQMRAKLMGGMREETILSPYSSLYLKPYIRRDVTSTPNWLKLMAEILVKSNKDQPDYVIPPRASLDYVYVQPGHIPAINSLCNQFFWPGIDLTECLQYPDFSCVALYRKLVVAFAFIVPDVSFHENYISFVFVRPGWRNAGIARFMIYHLIQTSIGKDITLHVSINNPALFLYQKFGFKVERVIQNFYDKYYRRDAKESKHAFFIRLER